MRQIINIVRKNLLFLIPYLLFLSVIITLNLYFTKDILHIKINSYHSPIMDFFFRHITEAGNGIFIVLVSLAFVLYKIRVAFVSLLSYMFSGIIVQLLKHFVFYDYMRPVAFLGDKYDLHLISGVAIHGTYSFPSGHSASIFGLCFCVCLYTKNIFLKSAMLLVACAAAFSRVYLSQHFIGDIAAGSAIGIAATILLHIFINRFQQAWINKNLFSIFSS